MTIKTALSSWAQVASHELISVLDGVHQNDVEAFCESLASAANIALHGLGREGLMMRALTMRLFHLGLKATPVGDMTTPPLGVGDLLVVSAGPGSFDTIKALMQIARAGGARILLLTAEPDAVLGEFADLTVLIPARTMARSVKLMGALPMGSAYEGALFLFFEYVVLQLAKRLKIDEFAMRARHTNLE